MTRESSRSAARIALPLAGALLAAGALYASPAVAMRSPAGADGLSPRLAELAKPSVRSAPDKFQAEKLGLPAKGPGSLLRDGNRVLVEIRFEHGAVVSAAELRAAGAKIVDVSSRYQTVAAAVKPTELGLLANIPRVASATAVLTPIVTGVGGSESSIAASALTPCFGAATSEGYEQLQVDKAQAEFELNGSGVKVGILSDSFDRDPFTPTGEAEDVVSGDLPGLGNPCGHEAPVEVLDDSEAEGADEGRAMAQIVHDLVPGAEISFATAFTTLTGFAGNIHALASAGANVIADDVSYFEEPFFQEGPVGVAAREVTEAGVSYFSAAGNDNLIHEGHNIASWEAPAYRDSGACPAGVVQLSKEIEEVEGPGTGLHPTHCMDFNPESGIDTTFRITVAKGATLIADLQWAEPWEGVATDIDAYLLGPGGTVVAGSAEDNVFTTKQPFELVGWENETGGAANVQLVINRYSGAANPRLKFALLENGSGVTSTEYETSIGGDIVGPTIFGHAGDEATMGVGAIEYGTKEEPEPYSSRGPVTHYFGPVNGIVPAAPISPEVISKPDLVATDGGANTFFGSCVGNVWRFYGTSAAAPHAAAVAALELQAEPAATPAKIEQAQKEAALLVGAYPATAVGSGLVDAVGALEKLGVIPVAPGATPVEAPSPGPCKPPRQPAGPTPASSPSTSPSVPSSPPVPLAPPSTFIRKHPPKLIRTQGSRVKVAFVFASNEPGVTFQCKIDKGAFRNCAARLVRRFKIGKHVLQVRAVNSAGLSDPTPAVFHFRVKRIG